VGGFGQVEIWRVSDWQVVNRLQQHSNSVLDLQFNSDSLQLASSDADSIINIFYYLQLDSTQNLEDQQIEEEL
jgi:WD40 repeat protein